MKAPTRWSWSASVRRWCSRCGKRRRRREIGPIGRAEGAPPITLAHNVATASDVDRILAEARDEGATVTAQAGERDWGGYSGYFADPDGLRWEIAYNPGPIGSSLL